MEKTKESGKIILFSFLFVEVYLIKELLFSLI